MVNCYVLFCHQSRYYYKSYNNTVVLNKSCLGQLKLACLHLWDSSGISKGFYGHEHLEPHTPGTDPYFLKLFYELDTQPYTVFTTFWGPHGILWLGLVEKKIATRTFGLSDMHATQTLRVHFLESRHTYSWWKKRTSSSRNFPTPDKRS